MPGNIQLLWPTEAYSDAQMVNAEMLQLPSGSQTS